MPCMLGTFANGVSLADRLWPAFMCLLGLCLAYRYQLFIGFSIMENSSLQHCMWLGKDILENSLAATSFLYQLEKFGTTCLLYTSYINILSL